MLHFFKETKKTPGDIVILHLCTTNDNHMLYAGFELLFPTSQIVKWIPITAIEMFHITGKMQSSFFVLK